jgi:hypothetical protein
MKTYNNVQAAPYTVFILDTFMLILITLVAGGMHRKLWMRMNANPYRFDTSPINYVNFKLTFFYQCSHLLGYIIAL